MPPRHPYMMANIICHQIHHPTDRRDRDRSIKGWSQGGGWLAKTKDSPCCAGLPAKLKPEWCRFRMGVCLVGEVRAEEAGVAPRDMGEKSATGPSYMPLGTALITAS